MRRSLTIVWRGALTAFDASMVVNELNRLATESALSIGLHVQSLEVLFVENTPLTRASLKTLLRWSR